MASKGSDLDEYSREDENANQDENDAYDDNFQVLPDEEIIQG